MDPVLPLPKRVDYAALGHIHRMQKVHHNAWYAGSVFQTKFDETLPKGVLVVDVGKRPKFVPVKGPRRLIRLADVPDKWPDAYIELTARAEDMPYPLPECVVKPVIKFLEEDSAVAAEIHGLVSSKRLLKGMRKFLTRRGLSPKLVELAMKYAHRLVEESEQQ